MDGASLSVDIKTLREAILREERTIAKNKEQPPPQLITPPAPPEHPVPVLSTVPVANVSRTRIVCTSCGTPGHFASSCWIRHPELSPPRMHGSRAPDRRLRENDSYRYRPRNRDDIRGRDRSRSRSRTPRRRSRSSHRRTHSRSRSPNRQRSRHHNHSSRHKHHRRHTSSSSSSECSPTRPKQIPQRANFAIGIPCSSDAEPPIDHACMVRHIDETFNPLSKWLLDSSTSHHYTCDRSLFTTYRDISPTKVATASGYVSACGMGNIVLRLSCGPVTISDVM